MSMPRFDINAYNKLNDACATGISASNYDIIRPSFMGIRRL